MMYALLNSLLFTAAGLGTCQYGLKSKKWCECDTNFSKMLSIGACNLSCEPATFLRDEGLQLFLRTCILPGGMFLLTRKFFTGLQLLYRPATFLPGGIFLLTRNSFTGLQLFCRPVTFLQARNFSTGPQLFCRAVCSTYPQLFYRAVSFLIDL